MNTILSLCHWTFDASLRASFLSVTILLLQYALRGLISARCRYALWLPVLLALTLPALPRSRWSAENMLAARMHASAPASSPDPMVKSATVPYTAPATSAFSMDWKELAAVIWAAGVAFAMGGGLVYHVRTLRRFMLEAEEPDDSLTNMIDLLSAELQLRHSPRVILSRAVESPAVTGLLRPVLLLPADFATTFSGGDARLVLKHELMHIKRLDLQVNALVCFLNALHWFNPVLWLAAARVRQDRETACDAQVLASEQCDCRRDYGHVLLKVQSIHGTRGLSLGFVGIFESGRALRSRIAAIARYRRPDKMSGIVAGAAIVLLGLLGVTHAQTNQPAQASTPGTKATATRNTEYIKNKLNSIIIPKFEIQDTTVGVAVELLKKMSVEFDTAETNPSRKGVNIVLEPGSTPGAQKAADGDGGARMSLTLTNTSLADALNYVTQLAALKYSVESDRVILVPASKSTP